MYYGGGILTASGCGIGGIVDHAILAVGYDAFSFKVRNSWGTSWGESGYIRIARNVSGVGTCGILTDPAYPIWKWK